MLRRYAIFAALLAFSWIVMTITHECGHIVGGMACGATLTDFDLVPWRMPYSLHSPDPQPLVTLWAGPLLGVVVPLTAASIVVYCVLTIGIGYIWFRSDCIHYLATIPKSGQ